MDLETAAAKLYGLLELNRKAVGVKLVHSEAEYQQYSATELLRPLPYCVAVKSAMAGKSIKQVEATSGCKGSKRALGLVEPTPQFFNGKHGHSMGLFTSEAVASQVASSIPLYQPGTYGVIIKPVDLFESDPDVVLLVASPRTMMRILQGYTCQFGLPEGMHMSGNQAVCVECTVTPHKNNSINVSMLCSGTRYSARWQDSECMAGIVFSRFIETVRGIEKTVNAVEPDSRKQVIESSLAPSDLLDIQIEYGKTYYHQAK